MLAFLKYFKRSVSCSHMACRRHLEFWSANLWDGKQLCTGEVVSICKSEKLELYPHQSLRIYFSCLILFIVNFIYCELHISRSAFSFAAIVSKWKSIPYVLLFYSLLFYFLKLSITTLQYDYLIISPLNMLTSAVLFSHHTHMWCFHQLIHQF